MNEQDWLDVKKQFELPADVTYLNNGSFGPCPIPVLDAAARYVREIDANPGVHLGAYREKRQAAKVKLGDFAGMRPDDLVFVTNLTVGMNMVAHGLRGLSEGDEVLTTDQEYGAVDNVWEFAARQKGFRVTRVTLPVPPEKPEEIIQAVESAITTRTRVMYFSHITTGTGLIMPAAEIAALARRRGIISVVDGAHAPGMIPLDIEAIGCDYYIGNCHKWLCAPKGTAFLWAHPSVQANLDPFVVGWGWSSEEETFLGNFENPGTHCIALPAAVGDAVDFQLSLGKTAIAARGRELASYTRDRILNLADVRLLTPSHPQMSCSLSAFSLPAIDPDSIKKALAERGIIVPFRRRDQDTWLRVSTHIYNTRDEIDLLYEALRKAIG